VATVQLRNELFFKAPTRVGLLADVAEALGAAGVDIIAIGAYDKGDNGEFLLLTSDNKKASDVLSSLDGQVDFGPVVVVEVENVPGKLAIIARRIANENINVSQIHATTTGGDTAMIVIRTDQDARVVELLGDL
jgi:hypothetical protein